jgi:hypothetical protein
VRPLGRPPIYVSRCDLVPLKFQCLARDGREERVLIQKLSREFAAKWNEACLLLLMGAEIQKGIK